MAGSQSTKPLVLTDQTSPSVSQLQLQTTRPDQTPHHTPDQAHWPKRVHTGGGADSSACNQSVDLYTIRGKVAVVKSPKKVRKEGGAFHHPHGVKIRRLCVYTSSMRRCCHTYRCGLGSSTDTDAHRHAYQTHQQSWTHTHTERLGQEQYNRTRWTRQRQAGQRQRHFTETLTMDAEAHRGIGKLLSHTHTYIHT